MFWVIIFFSFLPTLHLQTDFLLLLSLTSLNQSGLLNVCDTLITQVLLFIFCNENLKSITYSFWTRNNWSVLSIKQISEISSEVYDNCLNLSRPGQKKKKIEKKRKLQVEVVTKHIKHEFR